MEKTNWEQRLETLGIFWMHDGNPRRPNARLTSGLISNGFFNGGKLMSEHPDVFREACSDLLAKTSLRRPPEHITRIVGAAKGAILLAYELAAQLGVKTAYADSYMDERNQKRFQYDPRFTGFFGENEQICFCEDTITTGDTLIRLMQATNAAAPTCRFVHNIFALCNRSGKPSVESLTIIALIERHMPTWKEGENPYTPDGKELSEPVRAKTHWKELTQEYP